MLNNVDQEICFVYCEYLDNKSLKSLYLCNILLNFIAGNIFYNRNGFNIKKLNIRSSKELNNLITKYKIKYLKVYNLKYEAQLKYLYSHNVTSIKCSAFKGSNKFPEKFPVLENLEFDFSWEQDLDEKMDWNLLPSSIKKIKLCEAFNQKINNKILVSLESLEFGDSYNQSIDINILPLSLTYLKFNQNYNQFIGINVLPSSLTILELGDTYDQPIGLGVLPSSLTILKLGTTYNQPIELGILPSSLTYLKFGLMFNQKLETNVLPLSLTKLKLGHGYKKVILEEVLPKSLITLRFFKFRNYYLQKNCLPIGLKYIVFKKSNIINAEQYFRELGNCIKEIKYIKRLWIISF
jgi:hypothetical protein